MTHLENGERDHPPLLRISHAYHRYGDVVALHDVSLTVEPGEFVSLLGHSGSGKTTLLRVIAGLEKPTAVAAIEMEGEDVRELGAAFRNCTTVFQHYALFPHMSVGENVAYGLRVRGLPLDEQKRRVAEALALVRLPDLSHRRISQLSGGQRQRVALARSLVTSPALLLLDEPLGALDERLRQDMQIELLAMQKQLGIGFVYVTHSQEEALTMSNRVVVMRAGKIVQVGAPSEVFDRPASRFVADFMGIENLLAGEIEQVEGNLVTMNVAGARVRGTWCAPTLPVLRTPACAAVRAERVRLGPPGKPGENTYPIQVRDRSYRGKYQDWRVDSPLGLLCSRNFDVSGALIHAAAASFSVADCAMNVLDLEADPAP
jgi:spermidine/putrescine transport system ATP-binding protein